MVVLASRLGRIVGTLAVTSVLVVSRADAQCALCGGTCIEPECWWGPFIHPDAALDCVPAFCGCWVQGYCNGGFAAVEFGPEGLAAPAQLPSVPAAPSPAAAGLDLAVVLGNGVPSEPPAAGFVTVLRAIRGTVSRPARMGRVLVERGCNGAIVAVRFTGNEAMAARLRLRRLWL